MANLDIKHMSLDLGAGGAIVCNVNVNR